MLNGLREVHAHKLLHLDIKPSNIYLRADGTPVLLDFGASRQTLMNEQPILKPMYTPGFASPEQYDRRDQLGPWSDIYSVGASLYTCVVGSTPPRADERMKDDTLQPVSTSHTERYSAQLLGLVNWCLQLDPLARPQSVYALQKALAQQTPATATATTTTVATPPPPWFSDLGSRLKAFIGRT